MFRVLISVASVVAALGASAVFPEAATDAADPKHCYTQKCTIADDCEAVEDGIQCTYNLEDGNPSANLQTDLEQCWSRHVGDDAELEFERTDDSFIVTVTSYDRDVVERLRAGTRSAPGCSCCGCCAARAGAASAGSRGCCTRGSSAV